MRTFVEAFVADDVRMHNVAENLNFALNLLLRLLVTAILVLVNDLDGE